jgi:phosphatidylinositol glycan class N
MLGRSFRLSPAKSHWIIFLGITFHTVYLYSIVDIYFKSPIIHGIEPQNPTQKPLAKRLVLFVADGLRADKLYEMQYETPFLREIIETKGIWGISHTRVPTESRPGHVAMIAGFYEDVSAVTKGWKENPVEFDSVFNRSRYTWSWGSPDILPIFSKDIPHIYAHMYAASDENFATDCTQLDLWVFERVEDFLNYSRRNFELQSKLQNDRIIFFLHLLGIDSTGHAKRPYSAEYLHNIRVVDKGIRRMYQLFEEYFRDGATAYIFTSDHGMSDKGNHGDGETANTETPLICWGAGIRGPRYEVSSSHSLKSQAISPPEWNLSHLQRVDIEQASLAPFMATLLGVPIPVNSVGVLPVELFDSSDEFKAEQLFLNTKQILAQFLKKLQLKKSTTMFFKEYEPLANVHHDIAALERALENKEYQKVENKCAELIHIILDGLHYLHTYDWPFLMSVVTLGYLGWVLFVLFVVLKVQSQTWDSTMNGNVPSPVLSSRSNIRIGGGIVAVLCALCLLLQHSPLQYYLYMAFPLYFWTSVLQEKTALLHLMKSLWQSHRLRSVIISITFCVLSLEVLVLGFFRREVFSLCFFLLGFWGWRQEQQQLYRPLAASWFLLCGAMAIFTLLPVKVGAITPLVCVGGILLAVVGFLICSPTLQNAFLVLTNGLPLVIIRTRKSFFSKHAGQIGLILLATWTVYATEHSLSRGEGLPASNQIISWAILLISLVLTLKSDSNYWDVLVTTFLGLASPFILMSVAFETLFYCAFGIVLFVWIMLEIQLSKGEAQNEEKFQRSILRIAIFYIFFCYEAFFGTGNIASISSFELSSTYRFVTVFNPHLMAALLILKLVIPFILVAVVFGVLCRILALGEQRLFYFVIAIADIMTLNFFFLVRDHGSWLEIGSSISQFALSNLFLIIQLILFGISQFMLRKVPELCHIKNIIEFKNK